jgi:hypothetical protein
VYVNFAGLGLSYDKDSVRTPRSYRVNLNNPVPGSGAIPLGIFTAGSDNMLYAASLRVGDLSPSMNALAVGQTVVAAQINVSFQLNGRFYVLQMGPQPLGICHTDVNGINGIGTSSGTIKRVSQTKWAVDLPAGSVGRLFDASNTILHAVDKGLYYLRLHYEIGN